MANVFSLASENKVVCKMENQRDKRRIFLNVVETEREARLSKGRWKERFQETQWSTDLEHPKS